MHVSCFSEGRYYYIGSNSIYVNGQKARLVSEWFEPTSGPGRCLTFYYHMHGNGMGVLNVRIAQVNL